MKLVFLGSSSAFDLDQANFHSNMILDSENGSRLLIDCGSDIPYSLQKSGYQWSDITHIYLSHLHDDHVGGIEWLIYHIRAMGAEKPTLFLSSHLVEDLWDRVLLGGVKTEDNDGLESYFQVVPIPDNKPFIWEKISFQLIQVLHVLNGFQILPCYGLMFAINGTTAFLTADTQFTLSLLLKYYQDADIIFHDCETELENSGVHAHYSDLKTLAPEIKSKMWLYHYDPGELPDAQKDGFQGFVQPGQIFSF